MKGAYCLGCREHGPDLVAWSPDLPPVHGLRATVSFTCGRCGARWRWTVTMTANGPSYSDPQREDAPTGVVH